MNRVDAIDVALRHVSSRTVGPTILPQNMGELIRVAAEHTETLDQYVAAKNIKREQLIEAAQLYLQNMIIQSGDDPYKTLGLNVDATAADIKDHKRMLLKWLHPDLNKNRWQSALFKKVQMAADKLQKGDQPQVQPNLTSSRKTKPSSHKRKQVPTPYHREKSGRSMILRSFYMPALAIAAGVIVIYLLNEQFQTGSYWQSKIQNFLQ